MNGYRAGKVLAIGNLLKGVYAYDQKTLIEQSAVASTTLIEHS